MVSFSEGSINRAITVAKAHKFKIFLVNPLVNLRGRLGWDSLLSLYLSPPSDFQQTRSRSDRDLATQTITADLRFLFRSSNYWFSFFHLPTFFGNYSDPVRRHNLQPSLILAALAVSTFWQSSDVGLGKDGRDRALHLRDKAQSALESSFNSGWIDETLAQAAWAK